MRYFVCAFTLSIILLVTNRDASAAAPPMFTIGMRIYEHAPDRKEPRVIGRPLVMTTADQEFSITIGEVLPPNQAIDGDTLKSGFALVGVIRQLPQKRYQLEMALTDAKTIGEDAGKNIVQRREVEFQTILRDHETHPKLPTGKSTTIQISPTRWLEYTVRPYLGEEPEQKQEAAR